MHSSNKYIVVLIDHKAIYGIVNIINLNILSTDCINRRLTNISIYLSTYSLDVYHILRRLNFVPDAFSRLQTLRDDAIRVDEIVEPALDVI